MTSPQDPGQEDERSSQGEQPSSGPHQGGYQQYPQENPYAMPPAPEQGAGTPAVPVSLMRSFWLGIASVVVGFALLAVSFLFMSDADLQPIIDQTAGRGQPITLDQARFIYAVTVAGVSIFTAVLGGLWITFLFFMRRGRRWARIIITAVGVLWILLTLPSISGDSAGGGATVVLAVLQVLVVGGALLFAHVKPSNDFFEAARTH